MLDPAILSTVRLGVGCLLLFAAGHKLRHMWDFRLALGAYRLLPEWAVLPMARLLALAELALGVACLAQLPLGYVGAFALLSVYTVAILVNLARGRNSIDCGCGGPPQPLSYALVLRNALLLGACVAALAEPAPRPLGWLDFLTITAGLAVLALLYATLNLLLVARGRSLTAGTT